MYIEIEVASSAGHERDAGAVGVAHLMPFVIANLPFRQETEGGGDVCHQWWEVQCLYCKCFWVE